MYIIRPPPMSTRLAKDSARANVASEQATAIRASNFTTMYFMVVRLSPSIHLLIFGNFHKSHPDDLPTPGDGAWADLWASAERWQKCQTKQGNMADALSAPDGRSPGRGWFSQISVDP